MQGLEALEERLKVQEARLVEAERDKRRWQNAFRRLSSSLHSTAATAAVSQRQLEEGSDDTTVRKHDTLDAVDEMDESDGEGPEEAKMVCSEALTQTIIAETVDQSTFGQWNEREEVVLQAAVIAQLVADKHAAEMRQKLLHDRLFRMLIEALQTDDMIDTGSIHSSELESSTRQLDQAWSVVSPTNCVSHTAHIHSFFNNALFCVSSAMVAVLLRKRQQLQLARTQVQHTRNVAAEMQSLTLIAQQQVVKLREDTTAAYAEYNSQLDYLSEATRLTQHAQAERTAQRHKQIVRIAMPHVYRWVYHTDAALTV